MVRLTVLIVLILLIVAAVTCESGEPEPHFPGVFVIGFDGMDPVILEQEMASGGMPNFSRLAAEGDYVRLQTSLPPESPVAWANFVTGLDPGGHGVFDFVHRELLDQGFGFVFGGTKSASPSWFMPVPFTDYRLPLSAGGTKLAVRGKYFWEYLTERDIPVSITRIPSNYPPKDVGARTLSGMGTPDLQGSFGNYSFYTDARLGADPPPNVRRVEVVDKVVRTDLRGPLNVYRRTESDRAPPWSTVPLTVYLDAPRDVARVDVGEEVVVLRRGEWSDWIAVRFPMVPVVAQARGMVRLYLKEIAPRFRLYVSPVNVDPRSADIRISTPVEACEELAEAIGPYYTQGMAEETDANREGLLDTSEFLAQAEIVLGERRRMLDVELARFKRQGGLTFFYFSTTDLCAHVLWPHLDDEHPVHDPRQAIRFRKSLHVIYREMDRLLGKVRADLPAGTRLVVLSDHGFKSWRRQLNLNTWLHQNGHLRTKFPVGRTAPQVYRNVDWSGTRAYGVGFCGIYLNLAGREPFGVVQPGSDAEAVKERIIRGLETLVDPKTGRRVVTKVYRREDVYHGPEVENAPDLIVGYAEGYGCSFDSGNGAITRELFKDTDDMWGGSHLMDPSHVPGILLSNTKFRLRNPKLLDLPTSILAEFGITPEGLQGRRVW